MVGLCIDGHNFLVVKFRKSSQVAKIKAFCANNFRHWTRKSYCVLLKKLSDPTLHCLRPILEKSKIMRLGNFAHYGIHSHLIVVNQNGRISLNYIGGA